MIDIEFDEKDTWKPRLKSMKWLSDEKNRAITSEDYKIFFGKKYGCFDQPDFS